MREKVEVWARDQEADTWVRVAGRLYASLRRLTAQGARHESELLEPDITHKAHVTRHDSLEPGRRLRRVSDGAEFIIRVIREWDRPSRLYAVVLLTEAKATVANS